LGTKQAGHDGEPADGAGRVDEEAATSFVHFLLRSSRTTGQAEALGVCGREVVAWIAAAAITAGVSPGGRNRWFVTIVPESAMAMVTR
jgi:hypothetical protein